MSKAKTKILRFAQLLLVAVAAHAANYQIDSAHSTAAFTVRHMMVTNVSGAFSKVTGTVVYDPATPAASRVEAVIDTATIDTREPKRDAHLRSEDFFDVARYPTITFSSKRVEKTGEGRLRVVGDLTLHGVTREVVLEVEGPTPEILTPNGYRMGASATTSINRKDFGMTWNRALDAGGVVVGEQVRIQIDVALVRPAETKP